MAAMNMASTWLHLGLVALPLLLLEQAAAPQPSLANATATPSRVSIEYGGDVLVLARAAITAAGAAATDDAPRAETCTLTRLYKSGGYGLTHEKLGPDFKHCCEVQTPATRVNSSAVICHLPGAIATEGNTTVTVDSDGSFAYVRHYAAFVPEFSRRPYYRETEGAVIVRIAHSVAAEHALALSASLPCGGGRLHAQLVGQTPTQLSHFATYRVSFPLAPLTPTCYEEVNLTLTAAGLPSVSRSRTLVRAPPPRSDVATTAWSVDHESKALLVDGRRFAAQGWFAGGYAHESVGLPPITRVATGQTMHMNEIRKLGQSSLITEWGRQGHTFTRYGVAGADDIDFKPQTATLRESLDAAAAAGIGVLINVGVDRLAQAMVDFRGKPGKPRPPTQNLNTTELWGWVAGNISLVKDHPAVAAYYGCDDCCHMDIIAAKGMGEMVAIAEIKRKIFELDPHHLIWGSIACREIWMWSDESGNGLGLDVTMKEAYSGGVGAPGITQSTPISAATVSESTLRDFPMTLEPLVHMPNPNDMLSPAMMRAHVYLTLCQMNTMHQNYYVMNNNQWFDTAMNRAVDTVAAEMAELLPAVLSRREIGPPGSKLRPSPVVTSATAADPIAMAGGGGQQQLLTARIWEEEAPVRPQMWRSQQQRHHRRHHHQQYQQQGQQGATGSHDEEADEEAWFCARLVVVNSGPAPTVGKIEIAGLPAGITNASRLFSSHYVVSLTRTSQAPGAATLLDMIDGSSANVYQLGVGCDPRQAAGWAPVEKTNFVLNGDFESLEQSRPTQLASQLGSWHIYMPDGPGRNCQDNAHVRGIEDCAVTSEVYADDRARLTADTADPYEGRYSARIIIPTSLPPLVVPVPVVSDPEAPFLPGQVVTCLLQARASPPGVSISWFSSVLPQNTATPTPLLRPILGGVKVGADWTQVGPVALTLSNRTAAAVVASGVQVGTRAGAGMFADGELLQLQLVNPFETASQVWLDSVECSRRA